MKRENMTMPKEKKLSLDEEKVFVLIVEIDHHKIDHHKNVYEN